MLRLTTFRFALRGFAGALLSSLLLSAPLLAAETKTHTVRNKASSAKTCTSVKIAKNNGDMTVTPPAGATVTGPKAGETGTWEITGLAITPGTEATFTFNNTNGTVNYRFLSYDYVNDSGKTVWTGKCNDPIAFHVVSGGPGGENYLGYLIPAGQFGYFYQMFPNPTNSTTVMQAHLHLGPDSGAYNFQVLPNSFPHLSNPGFDLDDIEVPVIDAPDGYEYEVLAPYMDASQATGLPGIPTFWNYNPITGSATMSFGPGGLSMGQTGSIVAFTSPYPPTVTSGNVSVDYQGGIEPPCTGNFAPDALVPDVPDVPSLTYQALPELPGGSSTALAVSRFTATQGYEQIEYFVGRSRDSDLLDKAVVWNRPNGVTWQITPLPNPFGPNESAATFSYIPVQPNFADLAHIVGGHATDNDGRPQPVLWTLDGAGVWIANPVPLPPGMDSGALLDGVGTTSPESIRIQSAGWVGQGTEHHAAFCDMDYDGGGWTLICSMLPDNGQGFPSEATCLTHDNVHEDDVHIGGASATPTNPMVPSVWQPLPGGGFERVDLTLLPGAYRGSLIGFENKFDFVPDELWAVGDNAIPGGIDFNRGVLYRREAGVWSAPLELPPLPGMRDSRATSISVGPDATTSKKLFVGGLSYMELSPDSERATMWIVGPDNTVVTLDLTEQALNVPPNTTLRSAFLRELDPEVIPNNWVIAGGSGNDGEPGVTHAYILASAPPPDPLRTISPTQVVFGSPDVPPIPADFFGPGSLPFEGIVTLGGLAIPEHSYASAVIQRQSVLHCPGPAPLPRPCDPIPIELVELQLVSLAPISVSGPSETLWDVTVTLSEVAQPVGGLSAVQDHDNGGTFGSFLPVIPKFTFTNADDPLDVRVLDYGDTGHPPIQIQFNNVPWVAELSQEIAGQVIAPSNGNFVPLVLEQVPGDPTSQVAVAASGNSSGEGVLHTVGPQPPPPPPDPHFTSQPTTVQFGAPDTPPIPADFFGPGSEPFTGLVVFEGASQDSRDTLVQRSGQPDFSQGPASTLIVRAVSLNLRSVDPITVTTDLGEESQWDVGILFSGEDCNANGMDDTIDLLSIGPNGGTFDAVIPILPRLTFTRVDDPAEVRVLDYCDVGDPPIRVQFSGVPWVRDLAPHLQGMIYAPSDGHFVPGVLEQSPGDPLSQIVVQATGNSIGGGVTHTIGPPVGPRLIPAGEDCWETTCGETQYDFSFTPIPLGFFNVELDDNTLGYTDIVRLEDLGADTVVRRCADALFDTVLPSSVDVPIELVSLNLRSCEPIVVQDCCKPAELWHVEVTLSPTSPPACSGSMSLTKTHDNGGNFTSQFPVQALFRFTRVNPPVVTYQFDTALAGYAPEIMGASQPFEFVQRLYDPEVARACGVNFVPGVEEYLPRNPTEQYPQCCAPPRCHQFLGGSLHCTAPPDCSKCPGACCDPVTGACSHITFEQCTSVSGTFKGIRSKCEDNDADGIADDFETGTCCGPRDACNTGTDPSNPDTDFDGMLDGAELAAGFDACDPCDPSPINPGCPPQGSDCNGNTTLDVCDVAHGTSADCDDNQVPDECQPDCDFDACADACEILCGSQVDENGNGIPDDCESGVPAPIADPTGIDKSRFVSFSLPAPAVASSGPGTAVRVRLVSLHHVDPPYTGGPSVPFTSFEGQVRWVGPPEQYTESSSSGVTFYASHLQCVPHYRDWSTLGLVHVTGSAIVPSSVYEIENVAASCMGNEAGCTDVSPALTVVTTRWGDVETPYNPPSPTTQPDLGDVSALVNKFRSAPGAPIKARGLLVGFDAVGTLDIATEFSFIHIAACVDAFRGRPYPHSIAACP